MLQVCEQIYIVCYGQFYMRSNDEKAVPYGFKEVGKIQENYRAYENTIYFLHSENQVRFITVP